jgi:hypothetical protein
VRYTKPRDFVAYIALSAQGHPAVYLGYAFTKRALRESYRERFNADLESHGFTIAKVRVQDVS